MISLDGSRFVEALHRQRTVFSALSWMPGPFGAKRPKQHFCNVASATSASMYIQTGRAAAESDFRSPSERLEPSARDQDERHRMTKTMSDAQQLQRQFFKFACHAERKGQRIRSKQKQAGLKVPGKLKYSRSPKLGTRPSPTPKSKEERKPAEVILL